MRPSPATPILTRVLVAAAASMAAHAACLAQPYPPGDRLRFTSDAVTFGVDAIAFPSALLRVETATTIEVTLPADILFDFDKADLRPSAQTALHELAQLLKDKARGPVTIQGYTDGKGDDGYNRTLSDRRAVAVKTWLTTREQVTRIPFTTSGLGASNPVAPNKLPDGSDNPDGRQLNRRVTVTFRK